MRFLIIGIILFFSLKISAQNWEIQTSLLSPVQNKALPGNLWEGISFQLNYTILNRANLRTIGGLEFQGNNWANHMLFNFGLAYTMMQRKSWTTEVMVSAGNGLALFSNGPLYSLNPKAGIFVNRITKRNNLLGLGTGLQYLITPGYKAYSTLYQIWTIPVHLRFRF